MRKVINVCSLLLLFTLPFSALAHPGHEHSTLFHEALLHHIFTIGLIVVPFILLAFYLAIRYKRARQRS
jgi:heme/copper-type cytochrome/quinol oxidase subunit 2